LEALALYQTFLQGKNWDENLGRNVLIGAAAVPAIYAVSVGIPALRENG